MTLSPKGQTNRLLGYPPDARLLLVNADDFGMFQAINEAIFRTLKQGLVRSTTLMVPCPWALHAMQLLQENPDLAFGVHLTVISDPAYYSWGPLCSKAQVPSLVDETGYFYNFERMPEFLAQVKRAELEMEFRAQIETVLAAQLQPTHLDWHSLRFHGRTDILDLMFGLAKEYGLAMRVIGQQTIDQVQSQGLPCIDYNFLDSSSLNLDNKSARFTQLLRELPPGLSEWAVHPGLNNAELQAIPEAIGPIRQSDYDFLMSPEALEIVAEEGIILIDYRPLQAVWHNVNGE